MRFVPGVTLDDAQVLTGAGIAGPDDLLSKGAGEICDAIDSYLASDRGQRFRQRGYECDRRAVEQWIAGALRHQPRWRESPLATRWRQSRRGNRQPSPHGEQEPVVRDERGGRTRQRDTESQRPVRFHLDLASPIVDAPSIGPKTAVRLKSIGIHRVADLLAMDPISVSEQLKMQHVKADHVTAWQQQARLMCQVPRLRSPDAQILVGCGLTEAEEIADMNADELLALVRPFCDTKEGERALRGGQQPDLAAVSNWITWAGRRRVLEAA
jgi:hypothetical protein